MTREYSANWREGAGAILHPGTKGYLWQVTRFDADGFSGDSQYSDLATAERDLKSDGYTAGGCQLESLAATERFSLGNEKTQLIGMINAGGDHAAIVDAYAAGGLEAARLAFYAKGGCNE
jgi:hypothetical protein